MIKGCSKVYFKSFWRKFSPWLLASSWFLGIVLGIPAALAASNFLVPMMRQSVQCPVSILDLLAVTVVPFLLSAFMVSLSEPWILLIISTFKAFNFSFCACGISLAFGQCSWLVQFLFLFSDYLLVPLLYLYCVRHIQGQAVRRVWESYCYIGASLLIGGIDCFIVAPFLASLI